MEGIYKDRDERALNQLAIEELAQEVDQPLDSVKVLYEKEYARLKSDAKIMDYVALFASRHAREALRGRHM